MTENNTWIYIMVMFLSLSILTISLRLNDRDSNTDNNAPTILDIRNNQTIDIMYDIKYINVCRDTFPEGYNHRIHYNKCIVTFWRSDIEGMNNTNDS